MTEPLVCCVMLTRDRPGMARRAVECFRAQTYKTKILVAWDTGGLPDIGLSFQLAQNEWTVEDVPDYSIGELRNRAARWVTDGPHPLPDVLIHWDSDDWSHPNRIAEQVALLQQSGKECVGYNEMLFWREPHGEAWLYRNANPRYCVGTSLCYWRAAWERRPFPDLPKNGEGTGEDTAWLREVDSLGLGLRAYGYEPRMIASIHGGNTMPYNIEELVANGSREWTRVPWDDYCREKMRLEVRK